MSIQETIIFKDLQYSNYHKTADKNSSETIKQNTGHLFYYT